MLLQGPPVILTLADQVEEVAATKCQLEGGQLVEDATQRPDVSLVVVRDAPHHLRGHVYRSPTVGLGHVSSLVQGLRDAKVTNLQLLIRGQEYVGRLEVSVEDVEFMNVMDSGDHLPEPPHHMIFW